MKLWKRIFRTVWVRNLDYWMQESKFSGISQTVPGGECGICQTVVIRNDVELGKMNYLTRVREGKTTERESNVSLGIKYREQEAD